MKLIDYFDRSGLRFGVGVGRAKRHSFGAAQANGQKLYDFGGSIKDYLILDHNSTQ